jgi:hypothetical protein
MIAADAVVGVRLLALWARTRQMPELGFGSALLLLGAVGYPLAIAARKGLIGAPEDQVFWLGAALGLQNLGCAAMAVATASTFRARAGWAWGLAVAMAALLAGSWLAEAFVDGFSRATGQSAYYWLGLAGRVLPFLWSAIESWSYFARLRRRLRLGLADAAVTDRVRLWALSASGVVVAFGVFAAGLIAGIDVTASPLVLGTTSVVGCVTGISLWLAFLPPASYLHRIRGAERGGPARDPRPV